MAAPIDLSTVGTLEEQAYLVGLELQQLELSIPIENRPDNTSIAFDTEAATVNISMTLATNTQVVDGKAQIGVNAYL